MSEYYNMNRGLNYIKKHYNNSDQNELGEYVTELIDMIEVKDDIIEKQKEGLEFYGDEENYGAYYDEEDIFCIAPIEEDEGKSARELLKLTEE